VGKYTSLGTFFNNVFRNALNGNFDNVDLDIKAVDSRVSNIVANAGNSNTEIVDARQAKDGTTYTAVRNHTNAIHTKIDGMFFPSLHVVKFDAITVGNFVLTHNLVQLGTVTLG